MGRCIPIEPEEVSIGAWNANAQIKSLEIAANRDGKPPEPDENSNEVIEQIWTSIHGRVQADALGLHTCVENDPDWLSRMMNSVMGEKARLAFLFS